MKLTDDFPLFYSLPILTHTHIHRLFVDEPQPMKLFLKKLGYEVSNSSILFAASRSEKKKERVH